MAAMPTDMLAEHPNLALTLPLLRPRLWTFALRPSSSAARALMRSSVRTSSLPAFRHRVRCCRWSISSGFTSCGRTEGVQRARRSIWFANLLPAESDIGESEGAVPGGG